MISVDFSAPQGCLREIHGANIGPLCMNGYYDLSDYHRRVRFPTIRLHDCVFYCWEVVDTPSIFPLFHLDEQDPENYRFARTDGYLQSILDCGSQIVYRLGVTIQNHPTFHFNTDPPEDYDKWADICINIIRHYNEGWANGFHHNIPYWEIWNEAENEGPVMWNAPYEEYHRFYVQVTKRIKAACPDIKIGGPAACFPHEPRLRQFLTAVREGEAPLDFCSWHCYTGQPTKLVTGAQTVRALLDEYGYTQTESHVNEWNLGPYKNLWTYGGRSVQQSAHWIGRIKGAEGGALAASGLIALQDAAVDMSNFYDATNGPFGMFHDSGVPGKPYYAFLAFREMLDHTPVRCQVEGSDPDEGVAALAGSAADGSEHRVLLSNLEAALPDGAVPLSLRGLPEGNWQVEHCRLDAHSNLEPVDSFPLPADGQLTLLVMPRTTHLLRLWR
ncbi:MAG: hypothetical protein GX100_02690 [candidate division WS1 bacterium]|nr:hypothetical protein [candidate division WS1 bacterium]